MKNILSVIFRMLLKWIHEGQTKENQMLMVYIVLLVTILVKFFQLLHESMKVNSVVSYPLVEKAKNLVNLSIGVSFKEEVRYLEQAQDLLLEHLEIYHDDIDAWLLLTRLECNAPFYDPERIIKYTGAVLSYDKGNIYALLLLAYSDYYIIGSADDELVEKLSQAKSGDRSLLSLIEIAKARSWETRNKEEYEKCLLKSIELCKTHVANYAMLGELYIKQGRYSEGVQLAKQSIVNENREDVGGNSPADMDYLLEYFFIKAERVNGDVRAFVKEYESAHE
jgi:tetratricopeptide (TPR) repeat protein